MAHRRTTLALLPGWCETGGVFERLIRQLPPAVTPLVVELSTQTVTDWSVPALATRAADALTRASVDGPTVALGTSSGGYVAQQLAVDRPDLLDGLVLVGAPADLRGRPPFAEDVDRLTDPIDPEWVRDSLAWYGTGTAIDPAFLTARAAEAADLGADVWQASLQGLTESTPPLLTGTIDLPTLVLSGELDDVVGPSHDRILAAVPRARGIVYAATGHLVLWERPERVAADVAAFLGDLDVRR
ncbi:alpha/beta hydrolase [Isoptericola sp. b515]|uniref:alpha/beta fold hydrolase n=1 Tax=Isoptericola sp. b515 TaxID=3064652 RepID=UPI002713EEE0|nr:alpha/beta hydrolase [Isoptericola sp. b515]MDO8149662.1 alpha/beta hydrolase [Isoptericola sp. b515]